MYHIVICMTPGEGFSCVLGRGNIHRKVQNALFRFKSSLLGGYMTQYIK